LPFSIRLVRVSSRLWETLSNSFHEEGIDTLLLACTDLNVKLKAVSPTFRIIDSSACLAKAIVEKGKTFTPLSAKRLEKNVLLLKSEKKEVR
jgi:aspartate/glutamate racemase